MKEGMCVCINKVMKFHYKNKYSYMWMPGYNCKEQGRRKKPYYRVFPSKEYFTDYETFYLDVFAKHFKIIN